MSSASFHLIIPLAAFFLNIIIQIAGVRYVPKLTLLKSIILGFGCGFISLLFLELWGMWAYTLPLRESFALLIVNILMYSALGYCYFHFINLGETARRIRMVQELCDAEDGLTYSALLERYNAQHIITMRLGRLLHNRQIVERNNKYYIGSPIMRLISKTIILLKLLILGERSEFD